MSVLKSILLDTSRILTFVVYGITIYYLTISFFGLYRKREKALTKPEKKFALLIAAHNEELVISGIIESLQNQKYPRHLYDIFVIADNCIDKTAQVAEKKGALVFERINKFQKGKGYAIEWMLKIMFKMNKKYDAVAIFDADNLAKDNFLSEMNNKLCNGYKVVQGYLDSKNPIDTWITASYSIAFWSCNRMFQLARYNAGVSSQLGGTGFCIDTKTLKELGWGATCLTEDLEFTCKLVLNGYKVGWAHDAIIYDEKPLTLNQSWKQRKRWMQGFADVSSRYFFKLLKRAFKNRSWTALDCALYSIQPFVIIVLGISTLLGIFRYSLFLVNVHSFGGLFQTIYSIDFNLIKVIIIIFAMFQFFYTPLLLLMDKKLNIKIFIYYLLFPLYSITWFPIAIQGIMDKNKKEWSHTLHTRSVGIKDLEKVN